MGKKIYMRMADRILAKMVKEESEKLRGALMSHDYEGVRKWAAELRETIHQVNRNQEARDNGI